MDGSNAFGGETAPTEETATATATEPEAPQVTEPEAPEGEAKAPEDPSDPVLTAINDLRTELQSGGKPSEGEGASPEDVDLLAALEHEPEEPAEPTATSTAADRSAEGETPEQKQLREFEEYVDQRADARARELVTPLVEQQRERDIRALAKQYPDITSKDVVQGMTKVIDRIAASNPDGFVLEAPMVEMAYKVAKAELADADGAPAEQVVKQGASLETKSGQRQTDASSTDEQYKKDVFGSGKTASVFAGG